MIKSWKHKELKRFFEAGRSAKINPQHKVILRNLLFQLDSAVCPEEEKIIMMHNPPHPGKIVKQALIDGTGLNITKAAS